MQNRQTFRRTLFLAIVGIVTVSAVMALRAQAPVGTLQDSRRGLIFCA